MEINTKYELWLQQLKENTFDTTLLKELVDIATNPEAINDRFWRELAFGTGGLRGEIGAGSNRMNTYTVGKATQGLSNYLNKTYDIPSIAIAYDTRNFSREFASHAASVLLANGIRTYLFEDVRPTPMLSFAVRHLQASAGIVITASHNPKEYNGYKVYGDDGGQITDTMAAAVLAEIENTDTFADVKTISLPSENTDLFTIIGEEVDKAYYEKVKQLSLRKELVKEKSNSLKILYTPLHGSGNIPVRRILAELGFSQVDIVKEQELPDGNFPTTPYPNPEEPAVFKLAIEKAKLTNPDLIFATDPDCDRIGVLVKNKEDAFSILTGNQVGALLCDYIIKTHLELDTMPKNPAIIKTIVTSDMGKAICQKYGVTIFETLTGFKYIGELVGQWEVNHEHSFLLGFEESYGYLTGDFVRDKDAVIAAALITEMTLYYKSKGLSLFDAMEELYKEYSYYLDKLVSVTKSGQQGQQEIATIIDTLRENYSSFFKDASLVRFEDYKKQEAIDLQTNTLTKITLPTSNVLKFIFSDGSWFVLRPSGTEPKIKAYISVVAPDKENALQSLDSYESLVHTILGN